MEISTKGAQFIKNNEGLRLTAYPDTGGILTIGYGHTGLDVKKGMIITKERAEALFEHDVEVATIAIKHFVKVPLTSNQLAVLIDFTFNLGTGALLKSSLLKILNQGQYDKVPAQLKRYVFGKTNGVMKVIPGLVNRRNAEIALWNTR